ncbi:hypothetical protein [Billgrantia bachuensis]|uniref:Uncharacterized protein n=1 Tax=Billgrantia bachuensis TaxID=2717286 RepID=A0ABX0PRS4_9GAMM|nr:hypothetical protein [Halomonas bachuensis]NIC05281.1 hypothetical protein [Halomonas bachuensis]
MKSFEVVQMFKDSIAITKEKGVEHVPIESLEAYADELQELVDKTSGDVPAGEAAMEEYRAKLSAWVASSQHQHDERMELRREVTTTGQAALKSALLINGGAAVALLAFIGRIWGSEESQHTLEVLSGALLSFVFGVLSAAVAAGATYISQAGYADAFGSISWRVGVVGQVAAVIFVIGAYVLFTRGSLVAFKAIGLG